MTKMKLHCKNKQRFERFEVFLTSSADQWFLGGIFAIADSTLKEYEITVLIYYIKTCNLDLLYFYAPKYIILLDIRSCIMKFGVSNLTWKWTKLHGEYDYECLGFHSPQKSMLISVLSPAGYFFFKWWNRMGYLEIPTDFDFLEESIILAFILGMGGGGSLKSWIFVS